MTHIWANFLSSRNSKFQFFLPKKTFFTFQNQEPEEKTSHMTQFCAQFTRATFQSAQCIQLYDSLDSIIHLTDSDINDFH